MSRQFCESLVCKCIYFFDKCNFLVRNFIFFILSLSTGVKSFYLLSLRCAVKCRAEVGLMMSVGLLVVLISAHLKIYGIL